MKLEFYYDFDEDLILVRKWFPGIRKYFGKKNYDRLVKIHFPEWAGKSDRQIISWLKENETLVIGKAKKAGAVLEKDWRRHEKEFFRQVEQITGFKWRFRVYKCHLSSSFFIGGCYDAASGNRISVFPWTRHGRPLDTIVHELLHVHFWDSLERLGIKNKYNKYSVLSELQANLLATELKFKGFRSKTHVHPKHEKLRKKLRELRKKNTDYKEFLLKAVEMVT